MNIDELMEVLPPEVARKVAPVIAAKGGASGILPILKHLYAQLGIMIEKLEKRSDTCIDSGQGWVEGNNREEFEGSD